MSEQELVNDVLRLRSENMSDDEVAQRLLYQGHSNAEVFDAITQANMTPAYEGSKMEYEETQQNYGYEAPSRSVQPMEQHNSIDVSKVSEIAESIIEDKWSDLIDHVNRIIEWKSSMEMRLGTMEEQIKSMKSDFDILHKSILGRITDSDAVMRDVSTDIKALEQVFKKILPGFVENVNELSRITQNLKRK